MNNGSKIKPLSIYCTNVIDLVMILKILPSK